MMQQFLVKFDNGMIIAVESDTRRDAVYQGFVKMRAYYKPFQWYYIEEDHEWQIRFDQSHMRCGVILADEFDVSMLYGGK